MNDKIKIVHYAEKSKVNIAEALVENVVLVLVGVLGCVGTLFSYVPKFDANMALVCLVSLILASLFQASLSWKKYGNILFAAECIALLTFLVVSYKKIFGGFVLFMDEFEESARESGYEILTLFGDYDSKYSDDECVLAFVLAVVVLITVCLSVFVYTRRGLFLTLLMQILITFVGIFVDLEPGLFWFTLSVAFWIVALIISNTKKNFRINPGREACFLVGMILTMSLIVQLVVSQDNYQRPAGFDEIKGNFNMGIKKFMESIYDKYNGQIDNGNLNEGLFKAEQDGKTDLIVTMPASSSTVYLKSYTGHRYLNGMWRNDSIKSFAGNDFNSDNMTYDAMFFVKNNQYFATRAFGCTEEDINYKLWDMEITIEKTKDTKNLTILPYGSTTIYNDYEESPVITKIDEKGSYTLNYMYVEDGSVFENYNLYESFIYSASDTPEVYKFWENQEHYGRYVEHNYMSVPKGVVNKAMLEYDFTTPISKYDLDACIASVQNYFDENFVYNLDVDEPDNGEDIISYFLNETKEGYCMHFATAATLIFRELGVPARYAEGYIIRSDMFNSKNLENVIYRGDSTEGINVHKVEVTDMEAHAWVEIYIYGYGWIPVEVTPSNAGYREDNTEEESTEAGTQKQTQLQTQTPTQQPTESEEETESTKVQEESSSVQNSSAQSTEASTVAVGGQEDKKDAQDTTFYKVVVMVIAVVLLAVIAFVVNYRIKRARLTELVSKENTDCSNSRVKMLYKYFQKMLSYLNIDKTGSMSYIEYKELIKENCSYAKEMDLDYIFDTILKVTFGNQQLNEEEIAELVENISLLHDAVYKDLSFADRVVYDYFLNLHY